MNPPNDDSIKNGTVGFIESVRRRFKGNDIGRQFWMPDSISKQCYECHLKFTTLRRRHHCRICGQIFCSQCCNEMIDSKLLTTDKVSLGYLRVCKYCYKTVINSVLPSTSAETSKPKLPSATLKSSTEDGTSSIPPPSYSKWFFNSIGRRLSSTTISDMARLALLTNNSAISDKSCDKDDDNSHQVKFSRPTSSASTDCDLSLTPSLENQNSTNISTSYDAFKSLMAKIDETMDASEPNWVKEILEEARAKQNAMESDNKTLDDSESLEIRDQEEFDQYTKSKKFFFDEEDESEDCYRELGPDDEMKNIKLYNFTTNDAIVRYSPSTDLLNNSPNASSRTSSYKLVVKQKQNLPRQLSLESFYEKLLYSAGVSSDTGIFANVVLVDKSTDQHDDTDTLTGINIDMSDMSHVLFDAIYDRHSNRLLQQILMDDKLSIEWLQVMNDIAKKISNIVTLNQHSYLTSIENYYQMYSDHSVVSSNIKPNDNSYQTLPDEKPIYYPMDIRQRIKIKSIPNGSKIDCSIVNGLVFNKNVANKNMRTSIDNPKILLFACSIGYDERRRSIGTNNLTPSVLKLTMFDTMRLQENNYIFNLVSKIESLKPDVIFVQGSVSQLALEMLHERKITVVLNVKLSLLERIALFTGTYLIFSPEMILNTTRIGKCGRFRVQEFVISEDKNRLFSELNYSICRKSLMFLEGCTESIGCTVILRGSSRFAEFKKLKSILKYMIYVHYNSRFEKIFHQTINCLPVEEGDWNSPNELFQYLIRSRKRIHSSRSVSSKTFAEDADTSVSSPEIDGKLSSKLKLTLIDDNSDPLRAFSEYQCDDDSLQESFKSITEVTIPHVLKFSEIVSEKLEILLSRILLSSSPCIQFPISFLMTRNIHEKSSLRFYFQAKLLQSKRLGKEMSLDSDNSTMVDEERFIIEKQNDDDYANFIYLQSRLNELQNDKSLVPSEWSKLASLRNMLALRYMVTKMHPLLLNNDYDFKKQSQQFVADFRSAGPHLRCIPDIFTRSVDNPDDHIESFVDKRIDVDPLCSQTQQMISVLFSLYSPQSENAPNYCFKPKIVDIYYYGKNDMSLGAFLFRHFFFRISRFNQSSQANVVDSEAYMSTLANNTMSRKIICSNEACSVSMTRHLMRFTHHNGTLTVMLNKIQDHGQVDMPHQVMTWTFCIHCRRKSSYTAMSNDALALSFGKFLELKFYGDRHFDCNGYFKQEDTVNFCKHLLHKDCYQFFSFDQLIVSFKFDPISVYEIVTPAQIIPITRNHFSKSELIHQLKDLTIQCNEIFSQIKAEIETIKLVPVNKNQTNPALINLNLDQNDLVSLDEYLQQLKKDEEEFLKQIKQIHIRITLPDLETVSVTELCRIQNNVYRLKKLAAEMISNWNERINEFVTAHKRNTDKLSSFMNRLLPTESIFQSSSDSKSESKSLDNLDKIDDCKANTIVSTDANNENGDDLDTISTQEKVLTNKLSNLILKVTNKVASTDNENLTSSITLSRTTRFMAKATDYVSFEIPFEKQNQMFEHYQLPTYKDIAIVVRNKDPGSIIAYSLTTPEYDNQLANIRNLIESRLIESNGDKVSDDQINTQSSPNRVIIIS